MSEQVKLSLIELEAYHNQKGKQSGKYLRFFCPIHGGDHQRSFSLNPETGQFKCFTCGVWGYLEEKKIEWIEKQKENNKLSNKDTKIGNFIEKKIPVLNSVNSHPEPKARPELNYILEELQKYLPNTLGQKYLEKRKIPLNIAQKYGIGYAPFGRWPHVKDGFPVRQWKLGRIVFPHTNLEGEIVNLYGRAIEMDESVPKEFRHDHLPGMKGVFNAKAFMSDTVFICEGCFNALSLITAGYKDACAIFGVDGLRWEWVKSKRVVFCFDQDKAGQNWKNFALEGTLRGKEIFWLPYEIYGSYKDLNEVWMANGMLNIGEWES